MLAACLLILCWWIAFLTWTKALLLLVTVYAFRFCRSMLFLPNTALYSLHLGVSHIEHCSLGRAYHPSTKVTYVFGVTFMQLSAAYLTGTSGKDSMLITYYGTWLGKSQNWVSPNTPWHDLLWVGISIQKKTDSKWSFGHADWAPWLHLNALRLSRTILTLFMTISGGFQGFPPCDSNVHRDMFIK